MIIGIVLASFLDKPSTKVEEPERKKRRLEPKPAAEKIWLINIFTDYDPYTESRYCKENVSKKKI